MEFVDEIIGDTGSQSDYQVMLTGIIMHGCSREGQAVGTDGFGFPNRSGKGNLGMVTEFMKFGSSCMRMLNCGMDNPVDLAN